MEAAEGDGWIVQICNRLDEHRSELLLFEALEVAKGPIATIQIPIRMRFGLRTAGRRRRLVGQDHATAEPGHELSPSAGSPVALLRPAGHGAQDIAITEADIAVDHAKDLRVSGVRLRPRRI